MRNARSVALGNAVLHLVGDGPNRATVLSETVLNLAAQPEASEFVSTHITNSLTIEHAIAARFTDQQGVVAVACDAVFESRKKFLTTTQKIASCLGNIVREDRRLATGGLLIAEFSPTFEDGSSDMIGP